MPSAARSTPTNQTFVSTSSPYMELATWTMKRTEIVDVPQVPRASFVRTAWFRLSLVDSGYAVDAVFGDIIC